MKKALVLPLILVLGLGFATFASSDVQFGGDATTLIELSSTGTGSFGWWAEGRDSNGYMGARHEFRADGSYNVDASISVGPYGSLHTIVQADSLSPATFNLYGWQDFDVTNGHAPSTPYMREGHLGAYVSGTTSAHMDVDITGSMYIFKDHGPYTYPTTPNPNWMLEGEGDYVVRHFVGMYNKNTSVFDASSKIELAGTGSGAFGMSSAWAFSTNNSGNIGYPSCTTMYAQASGLGNYWQDAYGANYLKFNGFELPGGGYQQTTGWFNNGFQGNPSVDAN